MAECGRSPRAAETLAALLVGSAPDARRFRAVAGDVLARAGAGGRRVRIFGALVVDGDEVRLAQVLQSLLANAVRYSPGGGPVVVRVEQHGDQARILVTDVGIGIPADELPQVFQRFYRASNAASRHLSGMGVGLSMARAIVALHGGNVAAESREGVGSTFVVSLPLGGARS